MRTHLIRTAALLALGPALAMSPLAAQDLRIEAGLLHTAAGEPIRDAAVAIEDGRIVAVGPASSVPVAEGVEVLRAAVVTPGLVDARSTVGLSGWYNIPADQDMDETSDPATPALRALDGFNPAEPLIDFARSFGTTVLQASPGDINPIAGQTAVFKTAGDSAGAMALREAHAMVFNLGEAPKEAYGDQRKAPVTRMATAALIRERFEQARAYAAAREADEGKRARDLGLEALARVLAGELKAIFVAHRADDIDTALRLIREHGLDGQLAYATEGYLVADRIREAGVPVIVAPPGQRVGSMQTLNSRTDNAARLVAAGVDLAFGTGHESYAPKSRILLHELTLAVGHGLDAQRAIRAATIDAARLLGVADRVGSIEPGKDADLVLFDGDPFLYTSHVTGVVVDGRLASREVR